MARSQARPLTGSSLSSARRTLTVLLFPYREIYTHRTLARSPLFTRGIGLRDFARSVVERCTLESPRPDTSVNADLSLTYRDFSYRDFATRDVEHFILPTPDSRYADYPTRVRVDLSTSRHLYREFGVRDFANPDAMFRDFSLRNSDSSCHLSSTHRLSCGPHTIL
jgi:hypothetical protein